jgi:N-acetyl-alpha-D-muramate 1-phosphate uridylyltransferase
MNLSAMILAAGRGERMRPLTDTLPKPLVPVRGKPLIVHHIDKFVAMGIEEIVINVSYLAEKIQSALGDGSRFGCKILYSYEPEPLESGGGVATASALFTNAQFILASADVYSDIDYSRLLPLRPIETGDGKWSWSPNFDAHFVMIPPREGEPGREFAIGEHHRLNEGEHRRVSEGELRPASVVEPQRSASVVEPQRSASAVEPRCSASAVDSLQTLANVSVLKTELVQTWPRGVKFKLLPHYREWVACGRASGELFTGTWCNVTTMTDVEMLNRG